MPEILRLDAEKDWTRKQEHDDGDKKMGPGKKCHLFLRDRENKNESKRQNVSMSGVWEDSVCWDGARGGGATRGTER